MKVVRKIDTTIAMPLSKIGEGKPKKVTAEIVNLTINEDNETMTLDIEVEETFTRKLAKTNFAIGATYTNVQKKQIVKWKPLRWISKRSWIGKILPKTTVIFSATPISFDIIPEDNAVVPVQPVKSKTYWRKISHNLMNLNRING